MKLFTLGVSVALLVAAQSTLAGEYLVKYKNANALNQMAAMQTESFGLEMRGLHEAGQLAKVEIAKKNEAKTLARLMTNPNVEYVVPNFKLYAVTAPVSPDALREQYALAKVNADAAWKRAGNKGNKNV